MQRGSYSLLINPLTCFFRACRAVCAFFCRRSPAVPKLQIMRVILISVCRGFSLLLPSVEHPAAAETRCRSGPRPFQKYKQNPTLGATCRSVVTLFVHLPCTTSYCSCKHQMLWHKRPSLLLDVMPMCSWVCTATRLDHDTTHHE